MSEMADPAPRRLQVAALCWRRSPALEVLLVTTLRTRRWILPKGWPEPGMTPAQSAAKEALEEAGVTGAIEAAPLGRYDYLKEKAGGGVPVSVSVFALAVTGQSLDWQERGARDIAWLAADQAAAKVAEPQLGRIIAQFASARGG